MFDNAVGAPSIECAAVESMYAKGYALAEERGLINQPEPARPEKPEELTNLEENLEKLQKEYADYEQRIADLEASVKQTQDDYAQQLADYQAAYDEWKRNEEDSSNALVTLMRDEDQKGNRDFRDISILVNSIRQNFETVAVECAKQYRDNPRASIYFYRKGLFRYTGVMVEYADKWNESDHTFSPERHLGLGIRHKVNKGDKWTTYYLPFDAKSYDLKSYIDTEKKYMILALLPAGVSG